MKQLKFAFSATIAILLLTLFSDCNKKQIATARYEVLTEKGGTSIVFDDDTTYELNTDVWVANHSYPTGDVDAFASPNAVKKEFGFSGKDTTDVIYDNLGRTLRAYKGVIIKKKIFYGQQQPDKKQDAQIKN